MSTLLLDKPPLGINTIPIRPYQADAIDAIRREFMRGKKRTLLVLPTGTGKTVLFGNIVRKVIQNGGKSLVLAHRGELIDQAVNTLDRIGVECGVEKAGSYARSEFEPDCVVATVQTMQRDRLQTWDSDHFSLLIIDEAHHATSDTYQRVIKHFSGAVVLGVTATADRADEDVLSDVFESVAYEMSLWDAMTAPEPGPYLCRLKIVQCDVDIDLRSIRTTGGDFNQADLEEIITPLIETLANAVRQEVGDRSTLIFTPDVGSAQAMATALQSIGILADWVSGDSRDRAEKLAKYQDRRMQVLCSCALLTEGFDAPHTSAIVLCRPTKSRPLYAQMIGRGTRLSPGKLDCAVIDFNYITSKLDLVKPVDLFDTTHTDSDVLKIAQEIISTGKDGDLLQAIEKATEENEKRKVLRIQAREKQVKYKRVSYDPLAVADVLGIPNRGDLKVRNATVKTATSAQINTLKKFGVENAEGMSKARATSMLDSLISRAKNNMATLKQTAWAIRLGVEPAQARAMTFDDAKAFLDTKFNRRPAAAK